MVDIVNPNPCLKQLLKDLERKGGRFNVDFHSICKNNSGFYGAKGSAVRRRYQEAVDRLKRQKNGQEYQDIVIANGITPCAQTISNAMEDLKDRMVKAAISDTQVAEAAEKTVAKPVPTKKATITELPRATTPPPQQNKVLFSPPPSPGLFADMSVTSTTETTAAFDELNLDVTVGWTPGNPHIIPVPYGNGVLPHGFVSMFSDSVANDDWKHERDVFFLSKVIGGDLGNWKASIPHDQMEYKNRCILVEGPGLDYIHIDSNVMLDSLDSTLKLNRCPIKNWLADAIRRSIKKLRNAFARTQKKNQYYLFVYGEGVHFDNSAISGEGAADSLKTFGIKVCSKFGVFTKREHTNMVAFWAIATVADEDRRTDSVEDTLAEDVYDL